MISIQTAMLVGLGFLIASFLVVLLTPAYRARTVRLTAERVRALLPTTEAELKADKDRIRADSALRVHRLETELDSLKFSAARQLVEVSRRDGLINSLTSDLDAARAELEAAQNARNVLEQTIADRLPRVEQRLLEAKKLLFQRDREIAGINQDAERTQRALVEAVQINAQQRSEIDRLNMIISTRAAQNRDGLSDPTFDAEIALRAEIEALHARTRDQASAIDNRAGDTAVPVRDGEIAAADDASLPEVVRLQRALQRAESALKAMKDVAAAGRDDEVRHEALLRQRDQQVEEQAQEIARLKGALAAFEDDNGDNRALSIKDSKIAMKSKLSSLQILADQQSETIRKLRAEVAATNERLARQAQHFMEEMRRLGVGTLPTSAQPRRPVSAAERRSLKQRISEAKPELAHGAHAVNRPVLVKSEPSAAPAAASADAGPGRTNGTPLAHGANRQGDTRPLAETPAAAPAAEPKPEVRPAVAGRPRLLDRITDYSKS